MTDRHRTSDDPTVGSSRPPGPSGWFDRFLDRTLRKGETDGAWWLLDNLEPGSEDGEPSRPPRPDPGH